MSVCPIVGLSDCLTVWLSLSLTGKEESKQQTGMGGGTHLQRSEKSLDSGFNYFDAWFCCHLQFVAGDNEQEERNLPRLYLTCHTDTPSGSRGTRKGFTHELAVPAVIPFGFRGFTSFTSFAISEGHMRCTDIEIWVHNAKKCSQFYSQTVGDEAIKLAFIVLRILAYRIAYNTNRQLSPFDLFKMLSSGGVFPKLKFIFSEPIK